MSKQLPPNPHLESLKKQAKQLLKAQQSGAAEALSRVEAVLQELPATAAENFTLRDAQQVVAREYGFTSWQKLLETVGKPEAGKAPRRTYMHHCEQMAQRLVEELRVGRVEALARVRKVLPRFAGTSGESGADLSLEEAQRVIASENDFASWEALEQSVREYWPDEPPMTLDQMRGLERLHDEFARLLAFNFTFSEGVQQRIDVDTAFVDQTTFGEVVTSLSDSVRAFRFAVEGLDGDVVVDLALPVVEGLMAAGKSGGTERDRLEYFAERIARDLEKTWAPIVQVAVHSFEMETNRFALKLMPMYELVALEAFEVNARSAEVSFTGLVSLCYPVSAIEKFLPALDEYRLQAVAAAG